MTEHRLLDDTLIREADGIVALCRCGWRSRPCFSSMMASSRFQAHASLDPFADDDPAPETDHRSPVTDHRAEQSGNQK